MNSAAFRLAPSPTSPLVSPILRKAPTIKELAEKTVQKDKEESELKQKVLSSLLAEENPIEGFKKYLDLIIVKKTGKDSKELKINTVEYAKTLLKEISKDSATLKLENKLEQKINSIHSKNGRHQEIKLEDNELEDLKLLEEIRKKNNHIILTSQKLKNRMKLEKVDREKLFNNRTMKHFANLDTFINAKEFLEQINPLNKKDNENSKLRSLRLMKSIKNFQSKISSFFDEKIHDFLTRIEEENKGNQSPKLKDKTDSSSSSSSSSEDKNENPEAITENQYFKKLYDKVLTKKNTPEELSPKLTSNQKKQRVAFENLNKQKEIFKTLSRNSLFMKQTMGENNPFIKAFEEMYTNSSMIKKPRNLKDEKEELPKTLMKQLIFTDPSLNLMDFQSENQTNIVLDEFYDKTMMNFTKEVPQGKKIKTTDKGNEKNAIRTLEGIVQDILNDKKKKNEQNSNWEMTRKYEEFKHKSSNILKLISKTSKIIFNEKNKSFSDKRRTMLIRDDSNKMNVIKETRRKALTFDQNTINMTDFGNKSSGSSNLQSKRMGKNRFSLFFEKIHLANANENEKNIESIKSRKHAKTVSFHVPSPVSQSLLTLTPQIKKVNSFYNKNMIRAKFDEIMNETENVKEMYRDEKETIKKMQNEAHSFYIGQKIKLKPPLESLTMTFEPVKLKNYHRSTRSMIRDKLKKEKLRQVNALNRESNF